MDADNKSMAKFHETLRALMTDRGVSASVVSQATGIPKSSLSEWLSGRIPKFDEALVRLARFFGVSVEHLLTGEEPEVALVHDILEQAEEMFTTVHHGVYRLRVEKYVGKKGKGKV
jgi:transcriptional regulator with XRE-family HTH domain